MEQILSINKLAFLIGVPRHVLDELSKNKTRHYRPFTITETKRDGTLKTRRIDNPDKAMRNVQKRINSVILRPYCKKCPIT